MIELDYHTIQQPMFKNKGELNWYPDNPWYDVEIVEPYIDGIQKAIFADLEKVVGESLPSSCGGPGEFVTQQVPQATNFSACKREGCIAVGDYFHGKARVSRYREDIRSEHVKVIDTQYWKDAALPYGVYHHNTMGVVGAFFPTAALCYDGNHYIGITGRSKCYHPVPELSHSLLSELVGFKPDDGLITDAIADLNGKTMDLLTTVAEAPETVSMIFDALRSILLLIKDYKKAIKKLSSDTPAELWLQYRYGIMPLIYTVKDGLEVLENLRLERQFIDEKKKRTRKESRRILGIDVTEDQAFRVFLKRRIDPSKGFSNEFSINPFVTAWELVTLLLS